LLDLSLKILNSILEKYGTINKFFDEDGGLKLNISDTE